MCNCAWVVDMHIFQLKVCLPALEPLLAFLYMECLKYMCKLWTGFYCYLGIFECSIPSSRRPALLLPLENYRISPRSHPC